MAPAFHRMCRGASELAQHIIFLKVRRRRGQRVFACVQRAACVWARGCPVPPLLPWPSPPHPSAPRTHPALSCPPPQHNVYDEEGELTPLAKRYKVKVGTPAPLLRRAPRTQLPPAQGWRGCAWATPGSLPLTCLHACRWHLLARVPGLKCGHAPPLSPPERPAVQLLQKQRRACRVLCHARQGARLPRKQQQLTLGWVGCG